MTTIRQSVLFSLLLILLTLPWTAGCASTATNRSANTVSQTETLQAEYAKLRGQIGVTIASLIDVYNEREGKLAEAFKSFKKERSNLMNQASRVESSSSNFRSSIRKQLEGWAKASDQLTNEDLKAHAEERRQKVTERFDEVKADLKEAKTNVDAFFTLLAELQTVMANDLNASGVAALEDLIEDADDQSATVKGHIEDVEEVLEELARTLAANQPTEATE